MVYGLAANRRVHVLRSFSNSLLGLVAALVFSNALCSPIRRKHPTEQAQSQKRSPRPARITI